MDLINELISDHWTIRDYLKQLRNEKLSHARRKALIHGLLPLVARHADGEKKTLNAWARHKRALKRFATDDHEEHRALTMLANSLRRSQTSEALRARAHLFVEMLEHHLDEEEEEYFPEARILLEPADSDRLALRYLYLTETVHPKGSPGSKSTFLQWLSGRPPPAEPFIA